MSEERKGQVEKVLGACRKAYNSNIPIIYLLTDEMELADEIVNREALIPHLHLVPNEQRAITVYEAFQYENDSRIHEKDINIKKLLPYLKELLKTYHNPACVNEECNAVNQYIFDQMPGELRRAIEAAKDEDEYQKEKAIYEIEERDLLAKQNRDLINKIIDFLNEVILPDTGFYHKDRFVNFQKQIYNNQLLHELCRNRDYSDIEVKKRNRLLLGYALSKAFGRMPEFFPSIASVSVENREIGYTLSNFFGNYHTYRAPRIGVMKNFNLSPPIDNYLSEYIHAYINGKDGSNVRKSILILVAPVLKISTGFEPYIEVVKVPHLEDWEIEELMVQFINSRNKPGRVIEVVPNKDYLDKMTASLRGFGKRKIIEILSKIVAEMGAVGKNYEDDRRPEVVALGIIEAEKKQMLEKSGVLKNKEIDEKSVGGLEGLKKWIEKRKSIFDNVKVAKDEWNMEYPKGILVSGIPGTGKSLMAKETARILRVPLIQMDIGALMGNHMGESEENMRRAINMAEAMAPCVLWIDELEKGFAGAGGSGDSDGGTFKRVFASFLTWMQDKKAPCFIFATANNISQLPPEFLRRGRFDQKFYMFMPMEQDCIDIFRKILQDLNHGLDAANNKIELFDKSILSEEFLKEIVTYCATKEKLLIGADIDGIIHDAMAQIYFTNNQKKYAPGEYRYKREEFKAALISAIEDTKTYGETNLSDIASCFISLYENKFTPASGNGKQKVLFDFADFHLDKDPAIDLPDREADGYDAVLFNKVKTEINKQIHARLLREKNL